MSGPPALIERLPEVPGMHGSVHTLHQALHQIAPRVHLLSPTVNPEYVPEFHEIAIRLVVVDPRDEAGEVYKLPGAQADERALSKVALDRIAAAAGISWDPVRAGRLDDGSDPQYVHYRAVGYVRDLDGSRRTLSGEKEIDLRDGNPSIFTDDVSRMRHRYDTQRLAFTDEVENPGFCKGWSAQRLAEARTHILAMAESKAKNRVVRSLGVKQKYRMSELQAKPFAVLSLVLTGRSDDPALERRAKERMLDAAIETSREIYGASAAPARGLSHRLAIEEQAPPALPPEPPHAPPPVGAPPLVRDADEDAREDWIPCGCPDGPAGRHEEGCDAS